MRSVFHEGERAIQKRAGVTRMANNLGNAIHSDVPPAAQNFLSDQSMAILGFADAQGAVWSSLLWGEPGFLRSVDAQTVFLDAEPFPGDPLAQSLKAQDAVSQGLDVGMLAIELATRRRIRVNGKAKLRAEGGLSLHVEQFYANCPKFIQTRTLTRNAKADSEVANTQHFEQLSAEQQTWIAGADTFFIASIHREGGADCSHRGGMPGFIEVIDGQTLALPDYPGNNMFNTLGNLTVNPSAGLLFVDFETGATLQLTGKAQIFWDANRIERFPGAQRVVHFDILSVVHTENAVPLRWQFGKYSPFNPR